MIGIHYRYSYLKFPIQRTLEKYMDRKTVRLILGKSPHVYRALKELGPDIGRGNPFAGFMDFSLTFLAVYLSHDKKIQPSHLGEAMLSIADSDRSKFAKFDLSSKAGFDLLVKELEQAAAWKPKKEPDALFHDDFDVRVTHEERKIIIEVNNSPAENMIRKSGGKKLLPEFDKFDKRMTENLHGLLTVERSENSVKYTILAK